MDIDADHLNLWAVNINPNEVLTAIKENNKINIAELGGKDLLPTETICNYFSEKLDNERIHVIIMAPMVPDNQSSLSEYASSKHL